MSSTRWSWPTSQRHQNRRDNEVIETLVEEAESNLPQDRIETLAYDKADDDGKVHEMLHDHDIKPLIENRSMWPKEGEQ